MIFAVDDSEMDAELLRMTLERAGVAQPPRFFVEAEKALEVLRQMAEQKAALPRLLLLDIKMPGMSGLQAMAAIRADPRLDALPVAMLTSSSHPDDVAAARRFGAQCYLVKFAKPDDLRSVINAAERFRAAPSPRAIFDLGCNRFTSASRGESKTTP